jgi:dnd system-associated protein 4
MTLDEIYKAICAQQLYEFHTSAPLTVLREQMRRHCSSLDRGVSYKPTLFKAVSQDKYEVVMTNQSNQRRPQGRRVQRATDKEDLIKAITQAPQAPFKEIWRLMVFAALLGYRENRKEPLAEVDTGKGIDERYFANSTAWPGLLYLMALAETERPEVLSGEPEEEECRVATFEQYANGGLSILKEQLEAGGYSLDALAQLLATYAAPPGAAEGKLREITI